MSESEVGKDQRGPPGRSNTLADRLGEGRGKDKGRGIGRAKGGESKNRARPKATHRKTLSDRFLRALCREQVH